MNKSILLIAGLWFTTLSSMASADLIQVDNDKLKSLLAEGVPVVDVRRADEWKETGVVAESHLITFFDKQGSYKPQKWLAALSAVVNPEEPFVIICHSGARSGTVGKWLGKQFDTVYNVESGIASWIKAGNAVTSMP